MHLHREARERFSGIFTLLFLTDVLIEKENNPYCKQIKRSQLWNIWGNVGTLKLRSKIWFCNWIMKCSVETEHPEYLVKLHTRQNGLLHF